MESVSDIIKRYKDKDKDVSMIRGEDVISVNMREEAKKELAELEKETFEELKKRKEELMNKLGSLVPEMMSITESLNNEESFLGIKTYVSKLVPKQEEVKATYRDIEAIDDFFKYYSPRPAKVEAVEIDPDLKLEDASEKLNRASIELEQLTNDMIPFKDKSTPESMRDVALLNLYNMVKRNVKKPSVEMNDSKTRYISIDNVPVKVTVDGVQLPNGEYLNKSDVIDALNTYISTEKNRRFLVVRGREYTVTPEQIKRFKDILDSAIQISVNAEHQGFAVSGNSSATIKQKLDVPVGSYVHKSNILHGLDQFLETDNNPDKTYVQKLSRNINAEQKK